MYETSASILFIALFLPIISRVINKSAPESLPTIASLISPKILPKLKPELFVKRSIAILISLALKALVSKRQEFISKSSDVALAPQSFLTAFLL